jgi:hypothetical protein
MKTIKSHKKVVWAIEHRKNCLLKDDFSTLGFCIYSTKTAAEWAIANSAIEGKAVKVLITIERPNIYG